MVRVSWRRMSAVEHEQIWRSWREGVAIKHIARALGRAEHGVRCVLERHGGYVPALRQRRAGQFTAAEREEVFAGISAGLSARAIAEVVGKHHSSVSREIKRNGGRACYRPSAAEQAAWGRARRAKICLLRQRARLCRYV